MMRGRKQDDTVILLVVALVAVAVVVAWIIENLQIIILWGLLILGFAGILAVVWLLYRINRW